MEVIYNLLILTALLLTIIAIIKIFHIVFIEKIFDRLTFVAVLGIYLVLLAIIVILAEVVTVTLMRGEFKRNIDNAESIIIEKEQDKYIITNDNLAFYKNYFKQIKSTVTNYIGPNMGKIDLTIIKENGEEETYFIGLESGKYIGNVIWISKNGWFNRIDIGVIPDDVLLYKYFKNSKYHSPY